MLVYFKRDLLETNERCRSAKSPNFPYLCMVPVCVFICPILPHCYGPLRAVNGQYVLHHPSLLLTVRMLSTYGACISLLHEGTMRYGSFDPYGLKTYGACISLLHQGTLRYSLFDPYGPKT